MALTSSQSFALGTKAPDFRLQDAKSGEWLSLEELHSETATLIVFMCNHCPYVKHIQDELVRVAKDYQTRGVALIAISSNDPEQYPEDGPLKMREVAQEHHYPFPYLFDETQMVAKAYQANCTPDFYLFDSKLKCRYHGRFDDSTPGKGSVSGHELRSALELLLANKPINPEQKPSIGCSIKWKK